MNPFYFTFKHGHHDDNHESLGCYWTKIEASSEAAARRVMAAKRGSKFGQVYVSYDEIGRIIKKFNLSPIRFEHLTAQDGPDK